MSAATITRTAAPVRMPIAPTFPAILRERAAAEAALLTIMENVCHRMDGKGKLRPVSMTSEQAGAILAQPITDEMRAASHAYNAQVNAYNAQVRSIDGAAKAQRQARRNTAEVAQVRAAACPSCFSTHAGEC